MNGIDFTSLQAVFSQQEIEWRLQQSGEKNGRVWAICVPYVTNRAIMQRLDDVVGPARWKNRFRAGPEGGVLCGISIHTGEGWVTKWDGAENTDIEGVKGGLSGAMKRSAVQWGIGRYLYALEDAFARVSEGGALRGKTRGGRSFRWDPPALPAWAVPERAGIGRTRGTDRAPGDHARMLEFIREAGARIEDEATAVIAGTPRRLREFVRESWPAMKESVVLVREVVAAVEHATGSRFERQAA